MRPKKTNIPIIKQANEELKQATFLVLAPDEVDLHGDIYDATEVRKACHNFFIHCRKANLLHLFETDTFSVVENYISPVDLQMNDVVIKAGSWLAVLQFNDDAIWEGVKAGDYTGVSIGATATVEELGGSDD
jgi:hypothetical protein